MLIKRIFKLILSFLFPITCIKCEKQGHYICPGCASKIEIHPNNSCPFCGVTFINGRVCPRCEKKYNLSQLISLSYYTDPLIQTGIHNLKYRSVFLIARDLAQIMNNNTQIKKELKPAGRHILVPVPMHFKKQKQRGYNQAEILAQALSCITKIPIAKDLIIKKRPSQAQMKIKDKQLRIKNVQNAFEINKNVINNKKRLSGLLNKRIILIDDVATTGATLENCANTLKKLGFREVIGLVLARQIFHQTH